MPPAAATERRSVDRDIVRLALPALGALVVEPLFLLTDTALVGHLGATALAAVGLASVVLQTVTGLLVFLAYSTTPAVARALGGGDRRGAVHAGIDGMWLALGLGVVLALVGWPLAGPLVDLFGAAPDVADAATAYLTVSLIGLPGILVVTASTGLLRGLQDTRTPLVVATVGFVANGVLNAALIYGLGWGVEGSAAGTVVVQWAMAAVYVVIAVRAARRVGAPLRPGTSGVVRALRSGAWLFLRTASLRVAMLATVATATGLGTTGLATTQVGLTVFSTLAFALDALAIAGQALVGHGLGARDPARVRLVTRRLVLLGVVGGVVLGVVVLGLALSGLLGPVFSDSAAVRSALPDVLVLIAVGMPVAGYVFVLDGVLIGAGDARYLALAGVVNLVVYLPLLWWVGGTLAGLWAAFALGYIGVRAVTLGVRAHRPGWVDQALAR
ncbi:MATE family efflux transporter [Curtobacterium caseinilyticum]|uniref:MATE family efflux transporter n=1 Tax=Curtobacterium caseinilyticum TaxID=3055137 RepID=A0ABT7TRW7_9MICO|nr:MATE family efflux transporter [Curtobacterium caseinilyticum]MDM7892338.1 MATE family efflux transporter [Curtobacterium caseinilyticum]